MALAGASVLIVVIGVGLEPAAAPLFAVVDAAAALPLPAGFCVGTKGIRVPPDCNAYGG